MPQILLSENEYADELQLLAMEIQGVQDIYHTYEEINRLALSDESVMASLQRDAGFWNRQMYCLQLSLFIT